MWIIDFEASGLDKRSFPIEVGVTDGLTHYQSLIRPADGWSFWCLMAQAVHGISRVEIQQQGQGAREVAESLNVLLAGEKVYCDGFEWDAVWCMRLFEAATIAPAFLLEDLYDLLEPGKMINRFQEKKYRLSLDDGYRAHRALDDAQMIFLALDAAVEDD